MTAVDRILFFGTPEFAVPTLDALVAADRRPLRVITQPPRRAGRGRKLQQPPVAVRAETLGLPVLQPPKVKTPDFLDQMAALEPDLAIVIAFGQIFPKRLLELPVHGCINIHASLLPAHRGAAPIQAALAAGDAITGVCTMVMEKGLDTGPVLLRESTPIADSDTAESLSLRLAELGADLMIRTLEALEEETLIPTPQDSALASYAPRIQKADGRIDWSSSARELWLRSRAFTPWPGLHATLGDQPVKILEASVVSAEEVREGPSAVEDAVPGTYLGLVGDRLAVCCGGGTVLGVGSLQRPGRKALTARQFVNGERLEPGQRFG